MRVDSGILLNQVISAHKHSSNHNKEILLSKKCGCFYCLTNFHHDRINEWIDDNTTALCPDCGIDAVIGEASGYSIEEDFLKAMHDYWFN